MLWYVARHRRSCKPAIPISLRERPGRSYPTHHGTHRNRRSAKCTTIRLFLLAHVNCNRAHIAADFAYWAPRTASSFAKLYSCAAVPDDDPLEQANRRAQGTGIPQGGQHPVRQASRYAQQTFRLFDHWLAG